MTRVVNTWLRKRIERVKVHSCADGSFVIMARWKEPYVRRSQSDPPDLGSELPPGMFTRMDVADQIEKELNLLLDAEQQ